MFVVHGALPCVQLLVMQVFENGSQMDHNKSFFIKCFIQRLSVLLQMDSYSCHFLTLKFYFPNSVCCFDAWLCTNSDVFTSAKRLIRTPTTERQTVLFVLMSVCVLPEYPVNSWTSLKGTLRKQWLDVHLQQISFWS